MTLNIEFLEARENELINSVKRRQDQRVDLINKQNQIQDSIKTAESQIIYLNGQIEEVRHLKVQMTKNEGESNG